MLTVSPPNWSCVSPHSDILLIFSPLFYIIVNSVLKLFHIPFGSYILTSICNFSYLMRYTVGCLFLAENFVSCVCTVDVLEIYLCRYFFSIVYQPPLYINIGFTFADFFLHSLLSRNKHNFAVIINVWQIYFKHMSAIFQRASNINCKG